MDGVRRARRERGLVVGFGLAFGAALDAVLADPRRYHPVAGFGAAALALERRCYAPRRTAGGRYLASALVLVLVPAIAAQSATRERPGRRLVTLALTSWAVLGGTSLAREAAAIGAFVAADDLDAARRRLPSLCGRDPEQLDGPGLVRATVESVAENTSDAVVAPLLWGAVAGLPGLVGYRAINTLDAMVGHRSERYADFGTPAARLDDVVNWVPARVTAALAVVLAPLVGGQPADAWRAWYRDGPAHPSPNAGRAEAAFAGALGVQLGGKVAYPYGVQDRPVLGDGREPAAADVDRAVRLSRAVTAGTVLLVVACRWSR